MCRDMGDSRSSSAGNRYVCVCLWWFRINFSSAHSLQWLNANLIAVDCFSIPLLSVPFPEKMSCQQFILQLHSVDSSLSFKGNGVLLKSTHTSAILIFYFKQWSAGWYLLSSETLVLKKSPIKLYPLLEASLDVVPVSLSKAALLHSLWFSQWAVFQLLCRWGCLCFILLLFLFIREEEKQWSCLCFCF